IGENRDMVNATQKWILEGLQPFWAELLGIDEDEVSVSPDDNLIDWLKSLGDGIYEELDFADVHARLCTDLGLKASLDEFAHLLDRGVTNEEEWEGLIKPTLTLGRLADWIVEHTPMPSYTTVNIAGIPCQAAGTFLAIEQVVRDAVPNATSFGPSSLIASSLRGRDLDRVWCRLRFHTAGGLLKLSWPFEQLGCGLFAAGCGGAILSIAALSMGRPAVTLFGMLSAGTLFGAARKLTWTGNPLPGNIATFKNLSQEVTRALQSPS
ncbi:MAG: hypothetical protein KF861_18045, partial [Planctomycetaceae bacterium]|nr:hypothetical protein [Planctomycetaceae bacterium]